MRNPLTHTAARELWLRARYPAVAAIVLTALNAAVGGWLSHAWHEASTLFAPVPGALFAVWAAARASRARGRSGLAWRWIAVGCGGFAVGMGGAAARTAIVGSPPPPGTIDDLFYAIGFACLTTGLVTMARRRRGSPGGGLVLDALLIAISSLIFCWVLFVLPALLHGAPSRWMLAIQVIAPMTDLALSMACAVAMNGAGRRMPAPAVCLLVGGCLALVLGDAIYAYYQIQRDLSPGPWTDVPWIWSFFVVGSAALYPSRIRARVKAARLSETVWNTISGTVALAASALIVASDAADDGQVAVARLGVVGLLIALFVARQLWVIRHNAQLLRENRAYAARMASFNDELEQTVRERTRHLAGLQAVTAATKSSLHEEDVVRVCMEGTQRTLEGEGCAVWLDGGVLPAMAVGPDDDIREVLHRVRYRLRNGHADPAAAASGLEILFAYPAQLEGAILATWRHGKPFSDEEDALIDSIGLELGVAVFNARTHAQAAAEAQRDAVTGLLNRRAIQARLQVEMKRSQRSGEPISVMMLDLDDFKIFNDTYGHPVGDAVLRHIGKVLRENTRSFDVVGRFGGDEFIAVLPGADRDTARGIGERIRHYLYEKGFAASEEEVPLRLSYGISVYPDDGLASGDLLSAADVELYDAKHRRGGLAVNRDALREGLEQVSGFSTLEAMVGAVDNRDRYTRRHSEETTLLAVEMAKELGWSERELRSLRMAGLLHNVGKIGVPESILRKPGRLTEAETAVMHRHTDIGHALVRSLETDELVWSAARYHHERWDGEGYPRGLAGHMIPLVARIVSVADAFCAMTTHRPYRRAMTSEQAIGVLRAGAGSHWDPDIVALLERVWDRLSSGVPVNT